MSIRLRLTLIYTTVLTLVFFLFGISVYSRSKSALLGDVDRSLSDIAGQIVEETQAFEQNDVTLLEFPEDVDRFRSATTFMLAVDEQGEVTPLSENLRGFDGILDPNGLQEQNVFRIVTYEGQRFRVLTAPLLIERDQEPIRRIGYLQIARLLDSYDIALQNLRWTLLFAGWAAICVSLLLGDMLTQSSLKPLYEITKAASQITRFDDLSRRVPDAGRDDELGDLARALNRTLEKLEQSFRSQQRFFADVSHELRTPLTTIRGNVDLMRRFGADPDSLDAIEEEAARMTRLLNDLMFLARADSGALPIQLQPVELDSIFFEVFRQVQRIDHPVALELDRFEQARVMGDADRLRQVVFNLMNNAIKYTPDGGEVHVSLARDGDDALIIIADTGMGIPPEDLPHIFDRFYRVDKARTRPKGGFGLGLSIVKWIVEAHEGTIEVESAVGEGTTFFVRLPRLPDSGYFPARADDAETQRRRSTA